MLIPTTELLSGHTIVHLRGRTPAPRNPQAERYSAGYWGNTRAQTLSIFECIERSLIDVQLSLADVIAMRVHLAGDPARGGRVDLAGFTAGFSRYFGTPDQPRIPARAIVQVPALAEPGMLVEIEVQLARKKN